MTEKNKDKTKTSEKENKMNREKGKQKEKKPKTEDTERKKVKDTKEEKKEEKTVLPPLDFSSIILPFFTQALFVLRELEGKEPGNQQEKLELVKRLIDLLDLLKSRTVGNLKSEEQIFLDQSLHQLRMAYMEKAKIIQI